ncbi:unnamed protein product [Notodromas monacha]|uniref:DUF4378 domain-containing protein n=1 Tax=Notodromas monacha TaxID=399045 RepID=A0A7R9BGD8_9CRUS|nr:unnamed protein product [Notodromas monacha]CAG0914264.1 unnamed protein product [Notodromas monacha]
MAGSMSGLVVRDDSDESFLASLRSYSMQNAQKGTKQVKRGKRRSTTADRPPWKNVFDDITSAPTAPENDEKLPMNVSRFEEVRGSSQNIFSGDERSERLASLIAQTRKLREAGDGQEAFEENQKLGKVESKGLNRIQQLKREVECLRAQRLHKFEAEKSRQEFKCNHMLRKSYEVREVNEFIKKQRARRRVSEEKATEEARMERMKKAQKLRELQEKAASVRRASCVPQSSPCADRRMYSEPQTIKRSASVPTRPENSEYDGNKPISRWGENLLLSDERIRNLATALSTRLEEEGAAYLQKLRLFYDLKKAARVKKSPVLNDINVRRQKRSSENDPSDREGLVVDMPPEGRVFFSGMDPELSAGELSDDSETGADVSNMAEEIVELKLSNAENLGEVQRSSYPRSPPDTVEKVLQSAPGMNSYPSELRKTAQATAKASPELSDAEKKSKTTAVNGLHYIDGTHLRRALLSTLTKADDGKILAGKSDFGVIEALKCKLRINPREVNLAGEFRIPLNSHRGSADAATQHNDALVASKGVQACETVDAGVETSGGSPYYEDKALQTSFLPSPVVKDAVCSTDEPSISLDVKRSDSVFARVHTMNASARQVNPEKHSLNMASAPLGDTSIDEPTDASTSGILGYAPRTLDMKFRTELAYLETLEESIRQLGELYRISSVAGTQQDNLVLAEIVKLRQQELLPLLKAEEQNRQSEEQRKVALDAETRAIQQTLETVRRETHALIAQSTEKMTETQAQMAQIASDVVKEITKISRVPQTMDHDLTSAAVSAAIETAIKQIKKTHKLVHGQSSVSSLSEESTITSQGDDSKLCSRIEEKTNNGMEARKSPTNGFEIELSHMPATRKEDGSIAEEISEAYSSDFEPITNEVSASENPPVAVLGQSTETQSGFRRHAIQLGIKKPGNDIYTVGSALVSTDSPSTQSFDDINLAMVKHQLAAVELRARQQKSMLKMKEINIAASARSEMGDIENKRNDAELSGDRRTLAALKKRKELLEERIKMEKSRMIRLKEEVAAENKRERLALLERQERIIKLREQSKSAVVLSESRKQSVASIAAADNVISGDSDKENQETAGNLEIKINSEEKQSSSVTPPEENTLSGVASSKLESVPETLIVPRHSRSHSDDSKARQGFLLPNLSRGDLDRSFSASQLPMLERNYRNSAHFRSRKGPSHNNSSSSESTLTDQDDPLGRKAWRSLKRYEANKRREQQLHERRKNVEELLAWRTRLEKEELVVRKLEEEALKYKAAAQVSSHETSVVDRVEQNLCKGEEARNQKRSISAHDSVDADVLDHPVTESSIPEELEDDHSAVQGIEIDASIPEKSDVSAAEVDSQELIESEVDGIRADVSEERYVLHDSQSEQITEESAEETRQKRLREKFRSKAGMIVSTPLSPRTTRPKRRLSSGSDDSFSHTQTETSDVGSDAEGRIIALQEELKRRHREVERLKKEAKRRYREKLRNYNNFIAQTKRELEQELSDGDLRVGSVKPQIKKPKYRQKDLGASGINVIPNAESSASVHDEQALEISEECDSGSGKFVENEPISLGEAASQSYSAAFESSLSGDDQSCVSVATLEAETENEMILTESESSSGSQIKKSESIVDNSEELESEKIETIETESEKEFSDETDDGQVPSPVLEDLSRRSSASTDTIVLSPLKTPVSLTGNVLSPEEKDVAGEFPITEWPAENTHIELEETQESNEGSDAIAFEDTDENRDEPSSTLDNLQVDENCKNPWLDTSVMAPELATRNPGQHLPKDKIKFVDETVELLLASMMKSFFDDPVQLKPSNLPVRNEDRPNFTCALEEILEKPEGSVFPLSEIEDVDGGFTELDVKEKLAGEYADAILSDLAKEIVDEIAAIKETKSELDIVRPPRPSTSPTPPVLVFPLTDAVAAALDRAVSPVTQPSGDLDVSVDLLAPLSPGHLLPVGRVRQCSVDDMQLTFSPKKGNWNENDFVMLSKQREHEKLKEKQAQIEHEIKELEALQQMQQLQEQAAPFYLREIPNKPPPPYTPPKQNGSSTGSPRSRGHRHLNTGLRLSKSDLERLALEACRVIPVFKEEHETYLAKAAEIVFKCYAAGNDVSSMQPPPEYFGPKEAGDDPDTIVRRCYIELLFDLAKETLVERMNAAVVTPRPVYMKPKLVPHRSWLMPQNVDVLKDAACKAGLRWLGFEPKANRDRFIVEWTKKKKDNVDRILVAELQREEAAWTDFEEEEVFIKNKLTNVIFEDLVAEFVEELASLRSLRRKRVAYTKT